MTNSSIKSSLIVIAVVILAAILLYTRTFGKLKVTEGNLEIKDIDQSYSQMITIDKNAKYPHSVDITFIGHVNDSAIIGYGYTDSTFYWSDTVNGSIEISYKGDFYSDSAFINYKSLGGMHGKISINYKIYSTNK